MPVVVGVDSSTQSCKVELRDLDGGRVLGTGSAPHPPAFAPRSEQHPSDWWRAFELALDAAVVAAGRSDQPNQINNVLAFPGVFRGMLDAQARQFTEPMAIAAAAPTARVSVTTAMITNIRNAVSTTS